MELKYT
jgi:hypothetical protein